MSLKKTKNLITAVCLLSFISMNTLVVASEVHDAHTHGVANLTLAFDSGVMEVQFESPAVNLLGFENAPKNQQQEELINKTKTLLSTPTNVVSAIGSDCSPTNVGIDIQGPAAKSVSDSHAHHHEHEEIYEQADDEHESNAHSEIVASYQFDCEQGQTLKSISLTIFEHFAGLEKINVNWVTATQQGQAIARPKSPTIELR